MDLFFLAFFHPWISKTDKKPAELCTIPTISVPPFQLLLCHQQPITNFAMITRITSIAARRASTVLASRSTRILTSSHSQFNRFQVDAASARRSFFKAAPSMMPVNIVEVCWRYLFHTKFYVISTWANFWLQSSFGIYKVNDGCFNSNLWI